MARRILLAAVVSLVSITFAAAAHAGAPMLAGAPAIPPAGFIGFCARHLQECMGTGREAATVRLTEARRRELEGVQARVNAAIRPWNDPAHLWDYPTDGHGDCNRYALEKRRELIALGWPRDALLLTAAITERNEGHLVLVVRTSEGDLVLDNRVATVVDWACLPYRWISRQSQRSPVAWVAILERPVLMADRQPGRLPGSAQEGGSLLQ